MNPERLLDELRIPFKRHGEHHHTTRQFLNIDCPFCSPESGKWRLGINVRHLFCNCWNCGPHSLWTTLIAHGHVSTGQCNKLLKELEGALPQPAKHEFQGTLRMPKAGELLPAHIQYLKERGFNAEELRRLWHIYGIGLSHEYSWRILIPVHYRARIVSWTTRAVGNQSLRYASSPPDREEYPCQYLLYGGDFVRWSVVICEGPTDVWRIGPGAVAVFGTTATPAQLFRLASIPNRMICLDRGAEDQAEEMADRLKVFPGRTLVAQLDSSDPGGASPKEIARLRSFIEKGK